MAVDNCNCELTLKNVKNQRADFAETGPFYFKVYSENLMVFSGGLSRPTLTKYTKTYTLKESLNDPLIPSLVSQRFAHYTLKIDLETDKGAYDTLLISTTNLEYQRCWVKSTSFASNYLCSIGTNRLILNGFSYGSSNPGVLEVHVIAKPSGPTSSIQLIYLAGNDETKIAFESSAAAITTISNFGDCRKFFLYNSIYIFIIYFQ